ncbi:MAG: SocA family protein [Nitrospirae bacterium]|nr:SocA family protein [Candidatus Manganitrophaceae bacterium]
MLTCHDVAKYFLAQSDREAGDLISNLKLQKLVYYAQGFSLALNNEPIFPEKIEAWTHGPVIPTLYQAYKAYDSSVIPSPSGMDFSVYSQENIEFLDEIYSVFGQFSAWKLRNMTHEEPPWRDASEYSGEISHPSMKEYFLSQIETNG